MLSSEPNPALARRSWGEALAVYRHPRVLAMLFLGFSAGLPFLLIFGTLSIWLREAEITRSTIGFFSWIGLTYSIKVFWAPVVDRMPLPLLTPWLGRRRSWMIVAQIGVACGLLGMATTDPSSQVQLIAAFAFVVAFSSATQDIVVDAYRIEAVEPDFQGAMSATYQLGYRMALLAAGAGALYIAEYSSWTAAYLVMALLMSVGFLTALTIKEPTVEISQATRDREAAIAGRFTGEVRAAGRIEAFLVWFSGAVIAPFADFFARNGWMALVILAFIGVYRISDITLGIMAGPFYIDMGFTKDQIATATKVIGFVPTILGPILGGLLVARYGVLRPLLLGAILMIATNLCFAYLAVSTPSFSLLMLTVSADNLAGGLAVAAFIAYLSSLTSTAYTATQYALFSSLFSLPGKFLGGFSGVIVDATSYPFFFIYASLLGLPAVFLVLFLIWRNNRARDKDTLP